MQFLRELLRPANAISISIGVVGLIATIITYVIPLHKPRISYHTTSIQVVDQNETLPLSVIDGLGHRVTENVFVSSVTLWNAGSLPIDPSNVRVPLTVVLHESTRIIDARLDFSTSQNISGFQIDTDEKSQNAIRVGWRFFDPSEGLRIRIVYASKRISPVDVVGLIFGVDGFTDITPPPKGKFSLRRPGAPQISIAVALLLIVLVITSQEVYRRFKGRAYYAEKLREKSDTLSRLQDKKFAALSIEEQATFLDLQEKQSNALTDLEREQLAVLITYKTVHENKKQQYMSRKRVIFIAIEIASLIFMIWGAFLEGHPPAPPF